MNTPTNEALLKKIDEAPLLMSREAARKKLRKPRSMRMLGAELYTD